MQGPQFGGSRCQLRGGWCRFEGSHLRDMAVVTSDTISSEMAIVGSEMGAVGLGACQRGGWRLGCGQI